MTLRFKVVVVLACLTAGTTVAIGVVSYVGVADRLRAEVDRSLDEAARQARERAARGDVGEQRAPGAAVAAPADRPLRFEQILVQLLDPSGRVVSAPASLDLPVGDDDQLVAGGEAAVARHDVTIDGEGYRVLTVALDPDGGAVQLARSTAESDRLLDSVRALTVATTFAVTALAAGIGWLLARRMTQRLTELTAAAAQVAATGDLDVGLPDADRRDDEVAQLGTAFHDMLGALAESRDAQQRLVQDAGHELRTPLTSLRTNVAVLRRHRDLPPDTTERVLDQIDDEALQLTHLVNEIVELATDARDDETPVDVVLGDVVQRAASRTRARTGREVRVASDESLVHARPRALERAVVNLLDNACKFDADLAHVVQVSVASGAVEVCDRGPGIDDADLARVFDRFHRAPAARGLPGSGLGLAIVRDVVESHGGATSARNRAGGGACIGFRLPTI